MRIVALLIAIGLLVATPAAAADGRLDWPLHPRPGVLRTFDAPALKWNRGHRGVDLAGASGQTVYAAAAGTVVFAGELAGRPLVSIAHPGGLPHELRTRACRGAAGSGRRCGHAAGRARCRTRRLRCGQLLHWGAMWGAASRADYVDPLGLVETTAIRLKPLGGG